MAKRDERGRFLARAVHRYRLVFTDSPPEYVTARTPALAVLARKTSEQPHTITDMTVLAEYGRKRHGTPLLDRIYGPEEVQNA